MSEKERKKRRKKKKQKQIFLKKKERINYIILKIKYCLVTSNCRKEYSRKVENLF